MPVLIQKVLPDLVTEQGPLLVFFTLDVRIIHELGVKADGFERNVLDIDELLEAFDPGDDVISDALDAWWKPSFWTLRIEITAIFVLTAAVSGFTVPTITPGRASGIQILFDLLSAMSDLSKEHNGIVSFSDDGDAGCL